jgi:hypothetical protein
VKFDIGIQADTFADAMEALKMAREYIELFQSPHLPDPGWEDSRPPIGKPLVARGGGNPLRVSWRLRLVRIA